MRILLFIILIPTVVFAEAQRLPQCDDNMLPDLPEVNREVRPLSEAHSFSNYDNCSCVSRLLMSQIVEFICFHNSDAVCLSKIFEYDAINTLNGTFDANVALRDFERRVLWIVVEKFLNEPDPSLRNPPDFVQNMIRQREGANRFA
ncbi:MAG: hypothetical protein HRT44_02845, partial [Bdellovibrionales bacterium]|nr:hypothetical protein [Bdellovibrionales bacterium]